MTSYCICIIAFAQAKDLLGFSEKNVEILSSQNASEILNQIYPDFLTQNPSFRIAWDENYSDPSEPAQYRKTLAIIPPVSGG